MELLLRLCVINVVDIMSDRNRNLTSKDDFSLRFLIPCYLVLNQAVTSPYRSPKKRTQDVDMMLS